LRQRLASAVFPDGKLAAEHPISGKWLGGDRTMIDPAGVPQYREFVGRGRAGGGDPVDHRGDDGHRFVDPGGPARGRAGPPAGRRYPAGQRAVGQQVVARGRQRSGPGRRPPAWPPARRRALAGAVRTGAVQVAAEGGQVGGDPGDESGSSSPSGAGVVSRPSVTVRVTTASSGRAEAGRQRILGRRPGGTSDRLLTSSNWSPSIAFVTSV